MQPKTPVTAQAPTGGSKTLFVGNLSYEVEQAAVEKFFKGAGEIIGIRFSSDPEGNFKGFGHVEFATTEAAQKAMELNGENLCDHPVRLDLATERGTFTPSNSKDGGSFQKHTAFCKGFDTSLGEDEIRSSLEKHFGSCGEITRMSIPKDYDSGNSKGMACIDFTSAESFNKALELNGSKLDGYSLVVDEAKPRDGASGGRGAGRSGGRGGRSGGGGRSFGRDGGGGRSIGRDGGGRGGRGGGRSFG